MARSLTVVHEEDPKTSPLLTMFLLLAVFWMGATALFASTADASTEPAATESRHR